MMKIIFIKVVTKRSTKGFLNTSVTNERVEKRFEKEMHTKKEKTWKGTYSATCLLVLDCSALYDWAIQNTSPQDGIAVSKYSCDDWVK